MIVSKKELLNMYEACYDKATQVKEINKNIGLDLKEYAVSQEIDPKAMKAGFQVYKRYRSGGVNPGDESYAEILTIVEDSFGV